MATCYRSQTFRIRNKHEGQCTRVLCWYSDMSNGIHWDLCSSTANSYCMIVYDRMIHSTHAICESIEIHQGQFRQLAPWNTWYRFNTIALSWRFPCSDTLTICNCHSPSLISLLSPCPISFIHSKQHIWYLIHGLKCDVQLFRCLYQLDSLNNQYWYGIFYYILNGIFLWMDRETLNLEVS